MTTNLDGSSSGGSIVIMIMIMLMVTIGIIRMIIY